VEIGRDIAIFIAFVLYTITCELFISIKLVTEQHLIMIIALLILAEVTIGGYFDKKEVSKS
jgi:hypothetical protein